MAEFDVEYEYRKALRLTEDARAAALLVQTKAITQRLDADEWGKAIATALWSTFDNKTLKVQLSTYLGYAFPVGLRIVPGALDGLFHQAEKFFQTMRIAVEKSAKPPEKKAKPKPKAKKAKPQA